MNNFRKSVAVIALAAGMAAGLAPHAFAASSYDGTWLITAPPAGHVTTGNQFQCPPLHITAQVVDGKFTGSLERAYGNDVVAGRDQSAKPVAGGIDADGKVTITWEGVNVSGTVTHNHMVLSWSGECGPRVATGELF